MPDLSIFLVQATLYERKHLNKTVVSSQQLYAFYLASTQFSNAHVLGIQPLQLVWGACHKSRADEGWRDWILEGPW